MPYKSLEFKQHCPSVLTCNARQVTNALHFNALYTITNKINIHAANASPLHPLSHCPPSPFPTSPIVPFFSPLIPSVEVERQ